jgi:hypothetical protein
MTEETAQTAIVRGLTAAIAAHNEHRVFDIHKGWDEVARPERNDPRVSIALNFWEGWADSAAHQWLFYDGMRADDWPRLALILIDALEHQRDIVDPKLTQFSQSRLPSGPSRLLARVRALLGSMV